MSSINPHLKYKKRSERSLDYYVQGIQKQDRFVLGEAITLIESSVEERRKMGIDLLEATHREGGFRSERIAITGSPGVGKSTFIEAMGIQWIKEGARVAVLAIDPSSSLSSGSILGDKTRMQYLSAEANAFIRPSPAGKTLGGIAKNTKEAIQLCEAAGYDKIIVETVGVGQSETLVAQMVDLFLLLILPGSGDEVQGIKRGIMELADMLIVNKADGDRVDLAKRSVKSFSNALRLMRPRHPGWKVPTFSVSGLESKRMDKVAEEINRFYTQFETPYIIELRRRQDQQWFESQLDQMIIDQVKGAAAFDQLIEAQSKAILSGAQNPYTALESLFQKISTQFS